MAGMNVTRSNPILMLFLYSQHSFQTEFDPVLFRRRSCCLRSSVPTRLVGLVVRSFAPDRFDSSRARPTHT